MSTPLGIFGNDIFGVGWFGVVQDRVPISGTVVTENLENALLQVVENMQQIGNTVLAAGVDITEYVESISLKAAEDSITASCSIILIGDTPASVVEGAELSVSDIFRFEDGTTFTNTVFTGVIKSARTASGSKRSSVAVLSYDNQEAALSAAPSNTTWTGTNTALVQDELIAAGFAVQDLDFEEFTMAATDLSGFATVRDLIIAAAGAIDEVVVFLLNSGAICVKSVSSFRASGLTIPKSGYTYLQNNTSGNNKHQTVTVQGITGLTGTASGTGTLDYSETSVFITDASDCTLKAAAIVARTEAAKRSAQIPMNPIIRVGDVLSIVDGDDVTQTCRVSGTSSFAQWTTPDSSPGAWSSISLEDVTP